MRAAARTITALVTLLAVTVLPGTADAADEDPALAQGTSLPNPPQEEPTKVAPDSASTEFVGYVYGQPGSAAARSLSIRRTSDGTLVRTVALPKDSDPMLRPFVDGSSVVQWHAVPDRARRVEFTDIESGASTGSITVPGTDVGIAAGEGWALAARTTGEVHFLRADGTDRILNRVSYNSGWYTRIVAADSRTAVLKDSHDMFVIDLVEGRTTFFALGADPVGVVLTPERVYWAQWAKVGDAWQRQLRSIGRDGSDPAAVDTDLGENATFVAYGDGLAASTPTAGGSDRSELRRVDPTTGQLGSVLVADVMGATPMTDGRLALTLADTPTGRIAVLADDGRGPRTLADLPQLWLQARHVAVSGDLIAADRERANGGRVAVALHRRGLDSGWSPATADGSTVAHFEGTRIALAGGTLLTREGTSSHRLTWPAGSRLVSSDWLPILGSHGEYLLVLTGSSIGVQRSKTGEVVREVPLTGAAAVDGSWFWVWNFSTGKLSGTDLSGLQPDRTVSPGAYTCPWGFAQRLQVRGRWALQSCEANNSVAPQTGRVVDLSGVLATWQVPTQNFDQAITLGADFVAWSRYDSTSVTYSVAVAELAPAHRMRSYGPRLADTWAGRSIGVDTEDNAQFAYVDNLGQVRMVELDWLGEAPTAPDSAAPALVELSGSPRTLVGDEPAARQIQFAWSYTDLGTGSAPASGIVNYDVRFRRGTTNGGPYQGWVQPPAWQATTSTTVQQTAEPDTDTCFSVRARDHRGNLSDWSPDRCTSFDASTPVVRVTGAPRAVLIKRTNRIRYSYTARDFSDVRSYDVQVRTARPGRPVSDWTSPQGWTATTVTTQSVPSRAGEQVCFRVRALDQVGHRSAWLSATCASTPWDDSALNPSAGTTVHKLKGAYGGSVTQLQRRGQELRTTRVKGRQIALLAQRGPGQGVVELWVGRHRVGRVNLSAKAWTTDVIHVTPASPWTGAVRVVLASRSAVRIDGLAVLR